MNSVTLEDLVGLHQLDGVDTFSESIKRPYGDYNEDCAVIRFRLNGTVYTAIEDPSDGYRSSMDKIFTSKDEVKNAFPAIQVLGRMKSPTYGTTNDTLELIDVVTGKVVLEVGTDNSDDYYPSFVSAFHPENMATNQSPTSAMRESK